MKGTFKNMDGGEEILPGQTVEVTQEVEVTLGEAETQVILMEEQPTTVAGEEVIMQEEGIAGGDHQVVTEEVIVGRLLVAGEEMDTGEQVEVTGQILEVLPEDPEEEEEETTAERPFTCYTCHQTFTRQSHLTRHIDSIHGKKNI